MDDLSTDVYADYKNKMQEATTKKRNSTGKENAKLTDIESMQILQSTNYSSKEKDSLYSNYIMNQSGDGKKTEYEELKEYYENNSYTNSKNYKSYMIIDQFLDYKIKASDKLEILRASGEKTKDQSLNDKEKIQLLVDSNYTKEQTEALYVAIIANDSSKTKYEILKSMNQRNSIDDYLKFMLSDRESDKEDDGTKSGKSITGTKKKKIVNTIESLNLSKIAKIYLYGTEYNLNTSTERHNYNTLQKYLGGLSQKEQFKIVKTLKGAIEMKNGSYEY